MNDIEVSVSKDTASAAVAQLALSVVSQTLRRRVGGATMRMVQQHLSNLSPNKMGWPSQGFYKKAADGTSFQITPDGFVIHVDNEEAPGAMKHQYNGGQEGRTTISMKDKLMTIPARQEFYGSAAGQFANLKFGMFKSGTKFLYVGTGGADRINCQTGKSSANQKGIGARAAMTIAFWLKESVEQDAKPKVLPKPDVFSQFIGQELKTAMRGNITGLK